MNFETYLKQRIQRIPNQPKSLYDPIRYILSLPSKKLRARLALTFGGEDNKDAFIVATATEFLHNFTLIHDDIMDKAALRRGQETVHLKWDENSAILSGDALFAWAYAELLELNHHTSFPLILEEFTRAVRVVCEGQALDMDLEGRSIDSVTLEEYVEMIYGKTASLIEAALVMGRLVSQQHQMDIELIRNLGRNVGLAFQIQDDYLDAFGGQGFGKVSAGDIEAGKKTYLSLDLFTTLDNEQRTWLKHVFEHQALRRTHKERILEMMTTAGTRTRTEQKIRYFYDEALQTLEQLPSTRGKTEFQELIESYKRRLI